MAESEAAARPACPPSVLRARRRGLVAPDALPWPHPAQRHLDRFLGALPREGLELLAELRAELGERWAQRAINSAGDWSAGRERFTSAEALAEWTRLVARARELAAPGRPAQAA